MRILTTASIIALLAVNAASAGDAIAPGQAIANQGACMTVEGKAVMFADDQRLGVDVGLGDQDSNASPVFTAFVPSTSALPDLQSLNGQMVDITGVVQIYHGHAEIALTSPDQIMAAGTDPGKLVTCDNG